MEKSESAQRRGAQIDTQPLLLYLRRLHPMKTAERVGARINVHPSTVRRWLAGDVAPGFVPTLRLIKAYGPEILAVMLGTAPDWLAEAVRGEQLADLRRRQEALTKRMDELKCGRS